MTFWKRATIIIFKIKFCFILYTFNPITVILQLNWSIDKDHVRSISRDITTLIQMGFDLMAISLQCENLNGRFLVIQSNSSFYHKKQNLADTIRTPRWSIKINYLSYFSKINIKLYIFWIVIHFSIHSCLVCKIFSSVKIITKSESVKLSWKNLPWSQGHGFWNI